EDVVADAGVVGAAGGVWSLRDLAHVGEGPFGRKLRWRGGCGDGVGGLVDAPNDQRAEHEQAGDGASGAARCGGMRRLDSTPRRAERYAPLSARARLSSRAQRGILIVPLESPRSGRRGSLAALGMTRHSTGTITIPRFARDDNGIFHHAPTSPVHHA